MKSTTEKVFDFVKKNPNATLRQIATGAGLGSHTLALYHMKRLILSGKVMPIKSEKWATVERYEE